MISFRRLKETDLEFLNEVRNHCAIEYLHDSRTFSLSEYMDVTGVVMENGVLRVLVIRNVPEEAKPKTFDILDSFTPEEKVFAPSLRKKKKEIV
jgi:HSP20 family molecular chaperone IbpA